MQEEKHTHNLEEIEGLRILIASRASVDHVHAAEDIIGALKALGLYPIRKDVSEELIQLSKLVSSKLDKSAIADFTRNLRDKADIKHRHNYTEIEGLPQALDEKVNRNQISTFASKSDLSQLREQVDKKITSDHLAPLVTSINAKASKLEIEGRALKTHNHTIDEIQGLSKILSTFGSLDVEKLVTQISEKASRTHRHSFKDIHDFKAMLEEIDKHRYPQFTVTRNPNKTLSVSFSTTNGYYTPSLRIQLHSDQNDGIFVQKHELKFVDGILDYEFDLKMYPVNTPFRLKVRLTDVNNPKLSSESPLLDCRF